MNWSQPEQTRIQTEERGETKTKRALYTGGHFKKKHFSRLHFKQRGNSISKWKDLYSGRKWSFHFTRTLQLKTNWNSKVIFSIRKAARTFFKRDNWICRICESFQKKSKRYNGLLWCCSASRRSKEMQSCMLFQCKKATSSEEKEQNSC